MYIHLASNFHNIFFMVEKIRFSHFSHSVYLALALPPSEMLSCCARLVLQSLHTPSTLLLLLLVCVPLLLAPTPLQGDFSPLLTYAAERNGAVNLNSSSNTSASPIR